MERLTIKNSDGTYSQPTHTTFEKMFNKLAMFEDLCEKYQFANFEELKNWVDWTHEKCMEVHFKELKQENQLLKDRWEKLKEFIDKELNQLNESEDEYSEYDTDKYMTYGEINGFSFIKNKMQELEENMNQ